MSFESKSTPPKYTYTFTCDMPGCDSTASIGPIPGVWIDNRDDHGNWGWTSPTPYLPKGWSTMKEDGRVLYGPQICEKCLSRCQDAQ